MIALTQLTFVILCRESQPLCKWDGQPHVPFSHSPYLWLYGDVVDCSRTNRPCLTNFFERKMNALHIAKSMFS